MTLTRHKHQALPTIKTDLEPDAIRERLGGLSKRGKLPGYEPVDPQGICAVAAHGTPFDSKLVLQHEHGVVRFDCKMLPVMPRVFVLLLIITVWPGLLLTEDFLVSFDWYNNILNRIGLETWHWYLPLTVLPAPFAYGSAIRKSRVTAYQSGMETIEKLRALL